MTARDPVAVNMERYHGWHQDLKGRWVHKRLAPNGVATLQKAVAIQGAADRAAAESARATDIRRADTDDEYRERALAAIRRVAERCETFTTDSVHAEDPTLAGTDAAAGGRALGPAMLHAAREGWIVSTDNYGKSSRAASHARPMRIWRSLIVNGGSPSLVPTMDMASVVRP